MSKAITEKMVEAAMTSMFGVYDDKRNYDAWVPPHWEDARRKLSAALSAALSEGQAQQSVAIKPLEWTKSTRYGSFVAHGAGVMYAADQDHDCVVLAKWEGSSVLKSVHDTMEAAQAAAQSDYEARIRSALLPQQVQKAVGWFFRNNAGDPWQFSTDEPEICYEKHRAYSDAQPIPEAVRYAERLSISLWEKHWRDDAPEWKPLSGDLIGILTQIDNMTAGLVRSAQLAVPGEVERIRAAYDQGWNDSVSEPRPFAAARKSMGDRYIAALSALPGEAVAGGETPSNHVVALRKIADMIDDENADLDDAIDIARTALAVQASEGHAHV